MKYRHISGFAVITSIAIISAIFIFRTDKNLVELKNTENTNAEQKQNNPLDFFSKLQLQAKSVYIYDVAKDKSIFEKNSELQLPLASLTKLMVAVTASDIIPEYLLITVNRDDLREDGDTGLLVGERWRMDRLLDFALVVSSNDAIHAIARTAGETLTKNPPTESISFSLFIDEMNSKVKDIGLQQTYFLNDSGLDLSNTTSGGYGSAKDMAKLLTHALLNKPKLLEATSKTKVTLESDTATHNIENTNKILSEIPDVIASKTGYTELSGGNLVVAFTVGTSTRPVVISLLGSTYDGRFDDMKKLVSSTINHIKLENNAIQSQ